MSLPMSLISAYLSISMASGGSPDLTSPWSRVSDTKTAALGPRLQKCPTHQEPELRHPHGLRWLCRLLILACSSLPLCLQPHLSLPCTTHSSFLSLCLVLSLSTTSLFIVVVFAIPGPWGQAGCVGAFRKKIVLKGIQIDD